jgi:uncharacterized protein (TIGR00159 family)
VTQLLAPFLEIRLVDVVDVLLVATIVYTGLVWIRRTQAWLVAAGMLILAVVYVGARAFELQLTAWIFQGFFAIFVVMIVVIFQEELRQLFEQVAVWGLRRDRRRVPAASETADVLVRALVDFAHARIGALVVVPGRQPITRHVRGGLELGGTVSYPLVRSLFDPHSPGHDGAVVVDGDRVTHFAVQLPLSADFRQLAGTGTRHAAALGLAERCDALCVVVSEERGEISVAADGLLQRAVEPPRLGDLLRARLTPPAPRARRRVWRDIVLKNWVQKLAALALVLNLWYLFVPGARPRRETYPVPVVIANVPEGYELESVTPEEVWVTLTGPSRAFYLFDPGQIAVTVDAALAVLGRRTFQIVERDVQMPREVSFERVDPQHVKISLRPAGSPRAAR